MIGRVLSSARDEGTGFAVCPRVAVTACHVAVDDTLRFAVRDHRIAVERVERDEALDVAVLHLAEDAPAALPVGRAAPEARWRVEARPRDNDPLLTGIINAIGWEITNQGGHDVHVIQLHVDQSLDWHAGYSGAPVTCQAGDGAVVGVLVEQVLSRLPQLPGQRAAASDVLYAVPIEAALERFGLADAVRWSAPPASQTAAPQVLRRVSGLRVSSAVEQWRDRDELRAELKRLLLAGEHRVISVFGRRGIGKSALVAKVLADFEREDPLRDATENLGPLVYLSSRRSGDLTLAAVYDAVARVWDDGTRERLAQQWQGAGVDALPDLWEKLRHERPVVVLDNLDDLQDPVTHELEDPQLVELLDSAGRTSSEPTIVTTSQRPVTLPIDLVLHMCELEIPAGLTGADAVAVIRSGAPSEEQLPAFSDAELEELAARVDGRPRGLQKLGLLLHRRPRMRRSLMESESAPDEVVDELISTSYAVLPADQQLVVQLLALSRAPLPEAEIAGLLRGLRDAGPVQDAIDALVDAGEVKAYDDTALLELHPLDADHVRGELVADERDRQVDLDLRLADWWKARRKPFGAWRTLEDATPSKREYRHRWRAGRQADALAVMAEAARFLSRTGEGHLVAAAVRAADRELDPADVLAHYYLCRCRAMVEFFGGSLDATLETLRMARELAQRAGRPEEVTEVDLVIGKTLRHMGEADAALLTLAAVADAPADAAVTRRQRQAALFDLGLAALYARDAPRAREIADRLDALTEPGDPVHPRAMRADIRALTSIVTGDYDTAEAAAAEGVELFRETPYLTDVGYLMNVRALALLGARRFADALAQIEEGQAYADDYRDDRLVGFFATNAAWARLHAGDLEGALAAAERGAERLESNRVKNAPSPRALADAIRAHRGGGDPAAVRAALAEASALSLGNPDMYQPTDAFLAACAKLLAG